LSVEAVHVRLMDAAKVAVAAKLAGAVGGVVSSGGGGVVEEPLEQPPSAKSQLAANKNNSMRLHPTRLENRLFI
jgi:hypothetical protein